MTYLKQKGDFLKTLISNSKDTEQLVITEIIASK